MILDTVCYHGGAFFDAIGNEFDDLSRKNGIINADVLDAWFNPSPNVTDQLRKNISWISKTSPPTNCEGMRNVIARTRGLNPESILVGAGSSDLIFLALREMLNKDSNVLILDPMYGEYAHILENVIECNVDRLVLSEEDDYKINTNNLISLSKRYDLVILVNPNSPTGQFLDTEELKFALDIIQKNTKVWIDETYIEYVGSEKSLEQYAIQSKNIIVCKSMSKVYALSGLRSAYLCSSPELIKKLTKISPPWAVSLPAQMAAVYAIEDIEYYEKKYEETHKLRKEFITALSEIDGLKITDTVTNFILIESDLDSSVLVKKCRRFELYLRDVSNMGRCFNGKTVRIAVKDRETNSRMVKILKEVLV